MLEPFDKPKLTAQALAVFRSNAKKGVINCSPTGLLRAAKVAPNREEYMYNCLKQMGFLTPVRSGRGMRQITIIVDMKSSLDQHFINAKKPQDDKELLRELKRKRTKLEDDVDAAHALVQRLTDELKLINEQIESHSN